jgi:hypothetical protein
VRPVRGQRVVVRDFVAVPLAILLAVLLVYHAVTGSWTYRAVYHMDCQSFQTES